MSVSTTSRSARAVGRPVRRSPLRIAAPGELGLVPGLTVGPASARHGEAPKQNRTITAADLRTMAMSEFKHWLRGQTNKHKRPYQEKTISDYTEAVETLSQWMSRRGIEEDFPACGPEMLNAFFAEYLEANTQGGTNTRQRNLHHFFKWLEKTAGCRDPWKSEELVRYGPGKKRPSTLAMEYIKDLLAVTGGGNARAFEDARDHAILRMLGEGVRRTELEQQQLGDLPSDLIARPFTRVVPLKGAREYQEGRLVAMAPATARAVVAYLRFRQSHRHAELPALWLGRKGALTGSGVARMIIRRSEQANWDPAHQHQWRHTLANDLLDGGTEEGDLMRIMGWTDRSMVDRYAEDLQVQRAIKVKLRRGDIY